MKSLAEKYLTDNPKLKIGDERDTVGSPVSPRGVTLEQDWHRGVTLWIFDDDSVLEFEANEITAKKAGH